MKTHYAEVVKVLSTLGAITPRFSQRTLCGKHEFETYSRTDDWKRVDCKRCLRKAPPSAGRKPESPTTGGEEK